MGFDFEGTEPFQASTEPGILPEGNYVCTVLEAEDRTTKSGKPMIYVKVGNKQGTISDWLVVSEAEFSLAKIAGLFASMGVQVRNDFFHEDGHIKDSTCKAMIGKQIGVVVRDEDDDRPEKFGQKQPKVRGYCDPALVQADPPIQAQGLPAGNPGNVLPAGFGATQPAPSGFGAPQAAMSGDAFEHKPASAVSGVDDDIPF